MMPRWVSEGTLDPHWTEAPERGATVLVRVQFSEELETGRGEAWASALLKGRAKSTDEMRVTAMVTPTSKAPPKKLEGFWDVVLVRESERKRWKLESMTRRRK